MTVVLVIMIYVSSFLCIGFDFTKIKYKKYVFNLFCFLLVILASLKTADFSYDTKNYVMLYETAPQLSQFIPYANGYEPGWVLLGLACRCLGFSYHVFFFIVAAISIGIYRYIILKKCSNIFIALFTYVSCFYFLNEMIILRHGLATALVCLEIYFISENKRKYAFACLLIGITIHSAAIIGVFFFFIRPVKKPVYYFFIILLPILLNDTIFIAVLSWCADIYADKLPVLVFISKKIGNYLELEASAGGIRTFILYSLDLLLMFILATNLSRKNAIDVYLIENIIGFALAAAFILAFTKVASFARLNGLLLTNRITLSSAYLENFKRNKKEFVIMFVYLLVNTYIFLRQVFFNSGGKVF